MNVTGTAKLSQRIDDFLAACGLEEDYEWADLQACLENGESFEYFVSSDLPDADRCLISCTIACATIELGPKGRAKLLQAICKANSDPDFSFEEQFQFRYAMENPHS